ncbi:uncharacterized protein [Neodiprion pinetum]|uniref:uncharacterized protein n=1 Tax=Neodiprion pinetum TaxID=441929 RepID=UPI001EDF5074|nr:uncharacterized protein LOC124224763 [Neodiprion pinetum]
MEALNRIVNQDEMMDESTTPQPGVASDSAEVPKTPNPTPNENKKKKKKLAMVGQKKGQETKRKNVRICVRYSATTQGGRIHLDPAGQASVSESAVPKDSHRRSVEADVFGPADDGGTSVSSGGEHDTQSRDGGPPQNDIFKTSLLIT